MTACSSSDADVAGVPDQVTTTTTTVAESDCRAVAEHSASLLQGFVDDYGTLSIAEWNALDPPPDLADIRDQVVALAQAAVDLGCDPEQMETMLIAAIADLTGDGPVGDALAAAFRGDGPLFGPPAPITTPTTTISRNLVPTTVTIQPGQDLNALLGRMAPGSTVRFARGTHHFTEPIVVEMDMTFIGAGRDDTVISSSAAGFAVGFVGPGGFEARDLTIEHIGDAAASVVLAIEGPVRLRNTIIRGAVASTGNDGGGHGVVFAFEQIEGFPERTADERAGALSVENSIVTGHQSGGILITGDASPRIDAVTISNNGSCGLCYTGSSSGTVSNSTVDGNDVGIQIGDDAAPTISNSTLSNNATAGLSVGGGSTPSVETSVLEGNEIGAQISGESAPRLSANTITRNSDVGVAMFDTTAPNLVANRIDDNGEVGVQIGGSSNSVLTQNTVSQHAVGVLASGSATVSLRGNDIARHEVGIQIGGTARAEIVDNTVEASASAAISLTDASTAEVRGNTITDAPDLALQVVGSSSAEITGNTIASAGAVGISFTSTSAGTIADNVVSDRSIGVQVGGPARPDITGNTISDSADAGIQFGDTSGGRVAANTISGDGAVGVLVGGAATPDVVDNEMTGNTVGLVFTAEAAGSATFNAITSNDIGVQMEGTSAPFLDGNVITDNVDAGAVFGGNSVARFERNTVLRNGKIALQVTESAAPTISGNELRGEGVSGIIYRDTTGGVASGNQIVDHVYGIQVQGSAKPDLIGNTFEVILLTSIAYSESSGGSATGNSCPNSLGGGIAVSSPAAPTLGVNACTLTGDGIS